MRPSTVQRRTFGEDDGKTSFQVPINVAMEEPCSGVVSLESEGCVASVDRQHVTTRWVDEVGVVVVGDSDDIEVVAVHL